MGKEEKLKKEIEKVGAFNVTIKLAYLTGEVEKYDIRRWVPSPNDIAMEFEDGRLMGVNIRALKYYEVSPRSLVN